MDVSGIGTWKAGAGTAYAGYSATREDRIDAFYRGLSSAVEEAEGKGTGKLLGLTTIPYSNLMSYGMSATYSEKSTEEDLVIRISSNYGGEQRYYDVHVNEVNPRNATQLEMFALSCYTDDKGITDGGTFGSFHKMKTCAYNASVLGFSADLHNPENAFAKMDWISILEKMSQEYLKNPQMYEQYLNASNLAEALTGWADQP